MTKHVNVPKVEKPVDLSRRTFLVATTAAGLSFGFANVPGVLDVSDAKAVANFEPSIWYAIGTDGIVTVNVGKADMGQHIASTMAQLVAEELGADWRDMRVNLVADGKYADPLLGAVITGGSWSTRMNFDAMSRAGAAGRATLIEAAAAALGVPAAELVARDSAVVHTKSNKSISFGKIVASGKASKAWTPDELKAIKLKTADQYTLVGHSVPQLDIPGKTNGTVKYGIDATVPGMLHGKPVTPPVRYGASVKSVDDSEAKKVPGFVKAVIIEDPTKTVTGWVVAVANTYFNAKKAAAALKITYDLGPNATASTESITAEGRRLIKDRSKALLFVKNGDSGAALGTAAKSIEAEYTTGINIHAPMEPMNALAYEQAGIWHVHTGNQFATRSGGITAGAAGVDPKNVVLHQYYLGGGFGRRLESDMIVPAVLASKAVGKPVKVIYSREDDMQFDFTRPLTVQNVKASLDAAGKVTAMEHDIASAWPTARWGIPAFLSPAVDMKGEKGALDGFTVNGSDHWYTIPNHTVRTYLNEVAQNATPSGQLRSVAPGWTFWAVESMIDELAHAAGQDPLAFRISLLDGAGANNGGAQRLKNTLIAAAGLAGYGTKVLPKGEGMGIACVSSQERGTASWTACVAHVAVGSDGTVTVKKLHVATDIGTEVHPDNVRAQVEGAALWGLSLAMYENGTMKNGAIEQTNFDSYTPLRHNQLVDVAVTVIANGEGASGVGEPAVTVVGPAIGNAIFNASKARVRSLPITAEAVKAAMKA